MKTDSYRLQSRGFTVVELAVVILVIGILATTVIAVHRSSQRDAVESVLRSDLLNAQAQLTADNTFNGSYPATKAAADNGKGLTASKDTSLTYIYTAATNSYCLTASTDLYGASPYYITNGKTAAAQGTCTP